MEPEKEKRFIRNPRLQFATLEDEICILDIKTGAYYGLRDAAKELWETLEGTHGMRKDEVESIWEERFENPEHVKRLLGEILEEMLDKGFIEVAD